MKMGNSSANRWDAVITKVPVAIITSHGITFATIRKLMGVTGGTLLWSEQQSQPSIGYQRPQKHFLPFRKK